MLGKKAAWRNWLSTAMILLLIVGLMLALLSLPQPWRDFSFSGIFILFSVILWISILTWPRRKRRAGSLLWNLGRPSTYRALLVVGGLFVFSAILQSIMFVGLARKGFSGSSSLPEYYVSQIILYWSTAIYFFWAGFSRLQLRESGIYYKFGLIKWEQISSYTWEGKKGNTLTVWLKQRLPLFQTRSWAIPLVHKAVIERLLDQYLSRGTRKMRDYIE
jgi:hypothetical protein